MLTSHLTHILGREPDPAVLKRMLDESPGQLNFTHFLSLFGEKLHGKVLRHKVVLCMQNGGIYIVTYTLSQMHDILPLAQVAKKTL